MKYHMAYADGTTAELPCYCAGLVPGLIVVKSGEGTWATYAIVHAASGAFVKREGFHLLRTAKAALAAIAPPVPDMPPWLLSQSEIIRDHAAAYPLVRAILNGLRAEEDKARGIKCSPW